MSEEHNPHSRIHDLLGAGLGLAALGLLLSSPWQVDTAGPDPFYKGPLIFPLLVLSLLLGASLPSMYRLCRPPAGASWRLDGQGFPAKGLPALGLLVLFLAGLPTVGLEITTWLFLFCCMCLLGQRSLGKLIGLPTAVTVILSLVFKVFLDVWFPSPLLWEVVVG